jgi:hypothetical protein
LLIMGSLQVFQLRNFRTRRRYTIIYIFLVSNADSAHPIVLIPTLLYCFTLSGRHRASRVFLLSSAVATLGSSLFVTPFRRPFQIPPILSPSQSSSTLVCAGALIPFKNQNVFSISEILCTCRYILAEGRWSTQSHSFICYPDTQTDTSSSLYS